LTVLPGLADVDGEKNQPFIGEFMADFVDEGGFVSAEATPGGPEFEEDNFAPDGFVGELFASRSGGVKAGCRLFVSGCGEGAKSREDQYEEN
jgi:hypothetical protein